MSTCACPVGLWDTDYSYDPVISHTYVDNPAPSPSVEVFDGAMRTTEEVGLQVLNVPPTIEVAGPVALGSDHTLVKEFTIVDPGADVWVMDVSYGDGTPRFTTNLTGRTFVLSHVFPALGFFRVELDLRDDDGDHSTTRFQVVTDTPMLRIQPKDISTAELSWINHPAPFRVESSSAVSGSWQAVGGFPVLDGERRLISVETTNGQRFFRLALP